MSPNPLTEHPDDAWTIIKADARPSVKPALEWMECFKAAWDDGDASEIARIMNFYDEAHERLVELSGRE